MLLFRTGCNVLLDKIPPMSPAKMFACMKERERKEAGHVRSSTRHLSGGWLCCDVERLESCK